MTSLGTPGPSKTWTMEQEPGKLEDLRQVFQAFNILQETQKKAMGPVAVAGFSLDAEVAGCPGPVLDPRNQAPVGGVPTWESL